MSNTFDVCVVGLGPAGLGFALRLAAIPNIRILCVDSGPRVQERYCSLLDDGACRWARPCEMISGLGGASVLSGGKLSLFPAGRSMAPLVGGPAQTRALLTDALNTLGKYVPLIPPPPGTPLKAAERDFRDAGFVLRHYDSYRYRRSDLVSGIRNMGAYVESFGHEVTLLTTVDDIASAGDHFSLTLRAGRQTRVVGASRVVLATGRSGTELMSRLATKFPGVGHLGRYDVGVRLEFPYECWREIDRNHNDLKLEFGSARTFCVCTNGSLAPYRVNDSFLLEGYSEPARTTGLTNLGIVIRVHDRKPKFFRDILDRVATVSRGRPVRESLPAYLGESAASNPGLRSSITFWRPGRVSMCYPADVASSIRGAVDQLPTRVCPEPNGAASRYSDQRLTISGRRWRFTPTFVRPWSGYSWSAMPLLDFGAYFKLWRLVYTRRQL